MNSPYPNSEKVFYISYIPTPNDYGQKEFTWSSLTFIKERLSNTLNFKEYQPQQKDRLFFYPACDVPRYKVRNWVESIKGTVTIKQENATAKFASKQTIDACMVRKALMRVAKQPLMTWLKLNYPFTGSVEKLYEELNSLTDNVVYLERQDNWSMISGYYPTHYSKAYAVGYNKTLHDICGGKIDHWFGSDCIDPSKETLLATLLQEPHIYSQESLIKLINSNSAVIDTEMYSTLQSMFKSTNKEDHVTALTIMASSHLEKSLHYILLLLEEFGTSVIINMKERNHVNFKSMLEYIGVERWWSIDSEGQMSILMRKRLLTYEMLKEHAVGVKALWESKTNNKYFIIKTIEATEEVKNYFKQFPTQQN